ncbi:excalibur calcium-binding domain-containing protein [Mesorhizobium sp.]|uniref:excalibur calcium-binding domain-containing protein n=1 Tax=Mesorhizobium sp. TaxID=1871066 RepID=UPI0012188BB1|nr:excalibur calcium-binding domain-containing protein [Mesorhizobium sp.]TIS94845.1 MAG: excalibur calcium-binding domain-containing protein [Mesorhizobium sp.]
MRWYRRHWRVLVASIAVAGFAGWSIAEVEPKTAWDGARHLLAAPSCDAARAVGLAPARRGRPGYWSKHDADNDGIACEPWPRR